MREVMGFTVQREVRSTQHYTMGTNRKRASGTGRRGHVGGRPGRRESDTDTSHVSRSQWR